MAQKIAIGSDHGGFILKEKLKNFLGKANYKVDDAGTCSEESCDYPGFAYQVAKKVSDKKVHKGILICKSGVGMSIVANKLRGVRAAVCDSVAEAVSSREHNDTNVLVLSASRTKAKKAEAILKAWLATKALKGRHSKRVRQILEIEKKVFK